MSRLAPHIIRRGNVLYFRKAVPRHLVALLGRREIKFSLGSCAPTLCNVVGRSISSVLDLLFDELPRMQGTLHDPLEDRVREYFQRCLEQATELAHDLPQDGAYDAFHEITGLRRTIAELKASLALRSFSDRVKTDAREVIGPDAGLDALQHACTYIARAKLEQARILEAQLSGHYDEIAPRDPLFIGMKATGRGILAADPELAPARSKSISLREALQKFYAAHSKHWKPKTAADQKRVLNLVLSLLDPEQSTRALSREDVKIVRDALSAVPANYLKTSAAKTRPLKEVIAEGGVTRPLSVKTQSKYFAMFRQFLIWAENEGEIATAPGRTIKIIGAAKSDPSKDRDPYSPEQLQAIFNSPLFRGCLSAEVRHRPGGELLRDGKFWPPLIALFSGMRMGEILHLSKADVSEESGIWFFGVRGEHLKTASSKRRVPIHHALLQMGFLSHVAAAKVGSRLFADIPPGADNTFSHTYSKFWGRYARRVGFYQPRTSFHSLRHNFKDALSEAEVPEDFSRRLIGHADKSVHGSYGKGPSLALLKNAIDKVKYPVDLAFLTSK